MKIYTQSDVALVAYTRIVLSLEACDRSQLYS